MPEGPGPQRLAERVSLVAFLASICGSIALAVVYWNGGQPQLEGLALLFALGGVGVALIVWGRHLLDEGERCEERHPLGSSDPDRAGFVESLGRDQPIRRRTALRRMLLVSGGLFATVLVFPLRSLGPRPSDSVDRSPWRRGLRLVDEGSRPIRAADVPLNGLVTAFPEGAAGSGQGQVALVRVPPHSIQDAPGRAGWHPEGLLAYSKVCTHAGCPVSLYLADQHVLLCPCHQSSFDVLDRARPVDGPAARSLPQLPLVVDADGVLRAAGDLSAPVGPADWNRP